MDDDEKGILAVSPLLGLVYGAASGGPPGALFGALAGASTGCGAVVVKREIEEHIHQKSPVTLLDKHCAERWTIASFVNEFDKRDSLEISGRKFTNFVPIWRLKKVRYSGDYDEYNEGYTCGLNAINMSLKIWGYDKQMRLNQYSYKYPGIDVKEARWGMTGKKMYDYNIKNTFKYSGGNWKECPLVGTPNLNISYIDNTDYKQYTLMLVTGTGVTGHYILIIGVSTDKRYYLVTDQSQKIWVISYKEMKEHNLFYYRSNKGYSMLDVRSYYRLG